MDENDKKQELIGLLKKHLGWSCEYSVTCWMCRCDKLESTGWVIDAWGFEKWEAEQSWLTQFLFKLLTEHSFRVYITNNIPQLQKC